MFLWQDVQNIEMSAVHTCNAYFDCVKYTVVITTRYKFVKNQQKKKLSWYGYYLDRFKMRNIG